MKKSIQHLALLVIFLLMCLSADAQYFKPVWVNDIGGTGDSKATNIVPDNNGNIYISGYIRGTVTFNMKEGGSKTLTSNGDADVYIAKYSVATGNYVWAISFGGNALEQPNSMTLDNAGNVLVTGQFNSTVNFNPTGNFQLSPVGTDDIFVAKYTSAGNFVWAIGMGGGGIDRGHYIATDAQNNVFITASYTGAVDVDPSAAGVYTLPDQGSLSCFFAKYDANGNFVWAHPLGVVNQQNLTAITIDKTTNDVVITGDFSGNVDFSYSGQAGATFNSPGISNFIARYSNSGIYKWVKELPGSGSSILSSLKIDNQSNIIITGNFGGQFYPNGAAGSPITSKGTNDILVASYKSDGTLNWAENFGSSNSDASSRYISVDANNNIYVTGYFFGTVSIDPTLSDGVLTNNTGGRSVLIAGFNSSGKPIAAGAFGSSCTSNLGYEVAASGGDIYVVGSFCQTVDFDTGSCQTDNVTAINGTSDSFLARFIIANNLPSIITNLTIPQQTSTAIIDQTNHTITVTVATGSNVKSLVPTVTVNNSGTLNPVSGIAEDFSSPVIYNVSSGCATIPYTVTVILAAPPKTLTICAGASTLLTGDVATPTPDSYAWQVLQGGVWVNAPGVITNKDYQASVLTNATNANIIYSLRRQVTTAGVVADNSFYDVTVQPAIAISNNSLNPLVPSVYCSKFNGAIPPGGLPVTIIGNAPTGGNGTYTYQWQNSTDNITFANIAGAISKDLILPSITVTTYYRRVITSGSCSAPSTSNVIAMTIIPDIANNSITAPAVTAFCSTGDPAVIVGSTPTGGTGTYIYQWQSSADNTTFTDIAGATAKDYDPPVINSGIYYRRTVVSGACNTPLISNVVTISVQQLVVNNTVSYSIDCSNPGNTATITGSTFVNMGGFTYQWQSSPDNITFTDIAGAVSRDYSPPSTPQIMYYRRTIPFTPCLNPSNVVKITPLTGIANNVVIPPSTISFCLNGDPGVITGSIPTGGDGNYTYQWQSSTDNTAYSDIPGANAKDFDPPVVSSDIYYRRMVISGNCITALASNIIHITVLQNIAGNTITAPSVTTFCATGNPGVITGNVPIGGNNTYSYQWQSSADNATFIDIPGATQQNFDPAVINASTYYRRVVSSAVCGTPLTSNVVSITIANNPATPVPVSSAINICSGNSASVSVTAQAGLTYDWYDSATKTNHLFTGSTYVTGPLNANTIYYVQATSGTCTSLLASVQVSVSANPAAPAVSSTAAVCSGSAATLSVLNPQAGLNYNWYTTATGGTPVFTGTDFISPAITTATTYYVETANAGGCASASRTPANITVNPLPQVTAQGAAVCPGTTALLTASSTDQNATINWYSSATGGNILFTGSSVTTPALNANTTYYAEAADNTTNCVSTTRSQAQVQIIQPLDAPLVTVETTTTSSVTFQWSAITGATGYKFSTDNGQTFNNPSDGSDALTQTISNLQAEQSVTIIVRATGGSSCQLSASSAAVTGTAISPLGDQIFVPNAFTPNGDGKNDIVYVRSSNIKSLKFYVYDQWGELLYTSSNQGNGWDGTYKGTKEPVGVYVYYVEATMNDGHQVNKKGTITLLR